MLPHIGENPCASASSCITTFVFINQFENINFIQILIEHKAYIYEVQSKENNYNNGKRVFYKLGKIKIGEEGINEKELFD